MRLSCNKSAESDAAIGMNTNYLKFQYFKSSASKPKNPIIPSVSVKNRLTNLNTQFNQSNMKQFYSVQTICLLKIFNIS